MIILSILLALSPSDFYSFRSKLLVVSLVVAGLCFARIDLSPHPPPGLLLAGELGSLPRSFPFSMESSSKSQLFPHFPLSSGLLFSIPSPSSSSSISACWSAVLLSPICWNPKLLVHDSAARLRCLL